MTTFWEQRTPLTCLCARRTGKLALGIMQCLAEDKGSHGTFFLVDASRQGLHFCACGDVTMRSYMC